MIAYDAAKVVERYTMLFHREWWACLEGRGDLVFAGRRYIKVAEAVYCGFHGQEVLGCLTFTRYRGMIGTHYKFSLVKESLLVAHCFRELLAGYVRVCGYRVSDTQAAFNIWLSNNIRTPDRKVDVTFKEVVNHGTEECPVLEYRWGLP